MQRDPRALLWDVLDAGQAIHGFVLHLDVAADSATPLVYSAVERKFEIIGEALDQLAQLNPLPAASNHPSAADRGVSQPVDPWVMRR